MDPALAEGRSLVTGSGPVGDAPGKVETKAPCSPEALHAHIAGWEAEVIRTGLHLWSGALALPMTHWPCSLGVQVLLYPRNTLLGGLLQVFLCWCCSLALQ